MSSTPQGPYGRPPSGQPAAMDPRDFTPAARRPVLFGQGQRELYGVPKLIIVPNPPPGADWRYVQSGPSFYRIHSILALLTTSAQVATRTAFFSVQYSGVQIAIFTGIATQAASGTLNYLLSNAAINASQGGVCYVPFWSDFLLKDGMLITTNTASLQTGDQWSAIAMYGEEFTDKCLELL